MEYKKIQNKCMINHTHTCEFQLSVKIKSRLQNMYKNIVDFSMKY